VFASTSTHVEPAAFSFCTRAPQSGKIEDEYSSAFWESKKKRKKKKKEEALRC
jgi:hypothetical protein